MDCRIEWEFQRYWDTMTADFEIYIPFRFISYSDLYPTQIYIPFTLTSGIAVPELRGTKSLQFNENHTRILKKHILNCMKNT